MTAGAVARHGWAWRLFRPPPPTVITILGARSGTSALAGTLGLLGGTLPRRMMAANFANTKGYFEPQDLATLHDEILASVDSAWHDWQAFPPSWYGSVDAQTYRARLVSAYRENYGDAALAVLKEPRMGRILPLWSSIFAEMKIRPVFCFIDRAPLEVAASLQARDGSSIEQGLRYYIRNHLDAEHATRGQRRAFVSYDMLLADWRGTVASVGKTLGLRLRPTPAQGGAVDAFLQRDLRHQTAANRSDPADDLHGIADGVHAAFTGLGAGSSERRARARLDALRAAFDAQACR